MGARRGSIARAVLTVVAATALATTGCSVLPGFGPGPAPRTASAPSAPLEDDEVFGPSEVYVVDADATLEPAPAGRADAIWDLFVRVVTPEIAGSRIGRYLYADDPTSDTYAYVQFEDVDNGLWRFAANAAYADDPELLLGTLVHEYAHILSLHLDQFDDLFLKRAETCDSLDIDGGCLREDAWLADFHERFWAGYGDDAPDPDVEDPEAVDAFFLANEGDFVSDYAATNVSEDFAETFMTFVLEPGVETADPNASVVAAKIAFFRDVPELAAIRERIRSEFRLDS